MLNIKNEKQLENFLILKTSEEFSNLSEDCYYPKTGALHKDLLHYTGTNDKDLEKFSKKKFKNPKFKILHYPNNVLLILLLQKYLKENKLSLALTVSNLIALRYYSISMHKYIPYCKKDYFRIALTDLSQNHLFKKKDTIPGSLIYLSRTLFQKYMNDIKNDDPDKILRFVYEFKHRIAQSARSFAGKFHDAIKQNKAISAKDEEYITRENISQEMKIKVLADKLAKEITLYKKYDERIIMEVVNITKFNRNLAKQYAKALNNNKYTDSLKLLLELFLKDIHKNNIGMTKKDILEYTRKLMSIKFTNKQVYFKGVLTFIHDSIIKDLYLEKWFNKLSIQSKGLSRRFLAYYIILLSLENYLVS